MTTPQSYLTRRATRAVVRHARHGTASKLRRRPLRSGVLLALGAVVGALVTLLVDPRHRGARRQAAQRAAARAHPDDRTLTDRVKSEVFRAPDAPKGDVVIDAENGVVHLRGAVATADVRDELVRDVAAVDGVRGVDDRLHVHG
ncbi:BON domain-containing protein [Patulibacter defluvii]|uniref:BON domain-containing protein n=1 Tax=Patulibacter defluvii TaxID=3095358 RepID=UPI002A75DC84|nr:BON domain-containing protein [Patulibacter sp. DM4]